MITRRQRKSRSVGPGLKFNRLVPKKQSLDNINTGKYRKRVALSKKNCTEDLQRIAGCFEEMIDVFNNEVIINEGNQLEPENIQIPDDKLKLINDFEARILMDSINCKLSQEIQGLKELEKMINGGKEILNLDRRINDALEFEKSYNQKLKDLTIREAQTKNEIDRLTEHYDTIMKFTEESVTPVLNKISHREDLLSKASEKIKEIEDAINQLTMSTI
ncbi:Hypothetical protein SRAE_2000080700 [Strongyloides ratti]|uniref:Uncharacterized protein n=1 Tax=Strongyloides ratti TaxID=34506 RepID=A0A090L8S7_STRRB|nr:Hypothetical protein SRAE_2000080700 [Strongyloides ratti]CEF66137.1 Hypothetical protein SRAE_2000080700 [Strongyloides ratti]